MSSYNSNSKLAQPEKQLPQGQWSSSLASVHASPSGGLRRLLTGGLHEYRELKNHGIDPSIGWQANVEKWNREGIKPPIVESGMDR
ncbi:unnamed protein product [Prunus armeniaca]|uniref:Uncharacterized protein n=1 Tax=Prunus armeniaca TaxID=36596 RepID=A0A6J5W6S9_PRUAR|nr:unnamed protein product [Prunus armeniaca]